MKRTIEELIKESKSYIDQGWVADQAMKEVWDSKYDDLTEDFTDEQILAMRDKFFNDKFDTLDLYERKQSY
ncbi:hypothetical protein PM10SUCC1_28460 [Propionigenium maris DSM 9537]|uniref:Uncharacterized protein n=1 Tax=Propionigenium maris DSM 9537 TaxID=1123000 RepID=A0A9W6LP88_9FUSO|nr:hypothetical protein [Propionigenium maris]GLI57332.1 hypothetical protein PM10SUCC1_28460 [Propionigenium maris DSM 9537]